MTEFGLYFGSIGFVPFGFLTIILVEFYARKKAGSLLRIGYTVFMSPTLIAVLSVCYINFRQITHEKPGADIGLALFIPVVITMIVMSLIFSLVYGYFRTDLEEKTMDLPSKTKIKSLMVIIVVLIFVFLYFLSFFAQ